MELTKFFHRLLNPHCPQCLSEELTKKEFELELNECKSCEILQRELERAHATIERLTTSKVTEVSNEPTEELKPIPVSGRRFVPSIVRQQMQDKLDQRTLDLLIAAKQRTEATISEEPPITDSKVEEMERDILGAPVKQSEVTDEKVS